MAFVRAGSAEPRHARCQNSVYDPAPPPTIGEVKHDPPFPPPHSAIKVTCLARSCDGSAPKVFLQYRKDAFVPELDRNTNEWCETPMWDCGFNGDNVANDFIFTAIVPTNGSTDIMEDGDIMEFRIKAVDAQSHTNLSPFESWAGVSNQPLSYLCRFGNDPDFTGEYVTYHVIMTQYNPKSSPKARRAHRSDGKPPVES